MGFALSAAVACSYQESKARYDSGLAGLDLVEVAPDVLVPGTRLTLTGRSFVSETLGKSTLILSGSFDGGSGDHTITLRAPARFVDFEHLEVVIGEGFVAQLGARSGDFHGTATVEVVSAIDGARYASRTLGARLSVRESLTPTLAELAHDGPIFVNDRLTVSGDGLLLPGEGASFAEVAGCVARDGGACDPVGPVEVPIVPEGPFDRRHGRFAFVPDIAGIRPGAFTGTVSLTNRHAGGAVTTSTARAASWQVRPATLTAVDPGGASLGQFVSARGGGFVGGEPDAVTLLHLVGTYTAGRGDPIVIDTFLVPEFVDGHTVRYVINEDDDLGKLLDLRTRSGRFTGTIAPKLSFAGDEVSGPALPLELRFLPIKQIVYLDFTPQYVESLQAFGLRAVDRALRQRITEVVARDYATINLEVRAEPPADFAQYSTVEIGGPDPNGLGLLGYDNTPGKDVGNLRLYDRIGGVNATTQADGYPGFGGVFVESMFVFSEHPGAFVGQSAGADFMFDRVFDHFRPDQDGEPVTGADLAGDVDLAPRDGRTCGQTGRGPAITCAVWVLGSLIGSTVSHELGHSLGLANPDGPDPHILTDEPDRLMETGANRPFRERAELDGQGPGRFCADEYVYLRTILPAEAPTDPSIRPGCL